MFISGLGTAVPSHRYSQKECWEALQSSPVLGGLSARSKALLRKVLLSQNGIDHRHLALDNLSDGMQMQPDVLQKRFSKHAPKLAVESAHRALEQARLEAVDMEAVIVSTCTGYLCPGLSSYVIEDLGLPKDIFALDLVGHGCGAALPNLRTAAHLIASGQYRKVLCISVEICSAAFYLDENPGVLISACLFGDGAGALVASDQPIPHLRKVQWMTTESVTLPEQRDKLRFDHHHGMLRNILSPDVPTLAAEAAEVVFHRLAKRVSIQQSDIEAWLWHAGGRDVLQALGNRFELEEQDMKWSAEILRERGNISSPFVLHVLELALKHQAPGGYWWLSSFGAGFSSHGALLKVDES